MAAFRKTTAIIFYLLLLTRLSAQKQDSAFRIFFAIDEVRSEQNFDRVDSFINKLNAKTVNLKIVGYADYLSNPGYNLALSQRRANAVKDHLLVKTAPNFNISQCVGLGEKYSKDNGAAQGEAMQRRVDLVIERVTPKGEVDTRPITIPQKTEPIKPVDSGKGLKNLKKGKALTLEGLSFEPGRHFILRSSEPVLRRLLTTLQDNPALKIEIQGHVCCASDGEADGLDYDSGDQHLSLNRAKAVYGYLVKNGIEEERLSYKGYGHTRPKVDPERNELDEQTNRRVEILVLEDK